MMYVVQHNGGLTGMSSGTEHYLEAQEQQSVGCAALLGNLGEVGWEDREGWWQTEESG